MMSLCLVFDGDEHYADAAIVNAYYDHITEIERIYYPDDPDEELHANRTRKRKLDRLSKNEEGMVICEQWLSRVSNADIQLDDLFESSSEPVIYGEDIQTFIERLREGKERMKHQGDADKWERYFEMQLIALCEFALQNGHGVEFSV